MEHSADSDASTRSTNQPEARVTTSKQTSESDRLLTHPRTDRTGYTGVLIIVKNQNAFAKRAREMEKKRKAEEKRTRRKERKAAESISSQDLPDEESLAQASIENAPADDSQ